MGKGFQVRAKQTLWQSSFVELKRPQPQQEKLERHAFVTRIERTQ